MVAARCSRRSRTTDSPVRSSRAGARRPRGSGARSSGARDSFVMGSEPLREASHSRAGATPSTRGSRSGRASSARTAPLRHHRSPTRTARPWHSSRSGPSHASAAIAHGIERALELGERIGRLFVPDVMALEARRSARARCRIAAGLVAVVRCAARRRAGGRSRPAHATGHPHAMGSQDALERPSRLRPHSYHRGSVWPFDSWLGWGGLRAAGRDRGGRDRSRRGVERRGTARACARALRRRDWTDGSRGSPRRRASRRGPSARNGRFEHGWDGRATSVGQ